MSESLKYYFENISMEGTKLEKRVAENTERYRKGDFSFEFPNDCKVYSVSVKQIKSDFYFGANTFMLDSFDSQEKTCEYEEKFSKLFNYAVVGTFWKDYELEKGKYRFEKGSEFIRRRPPIDSVVEFCNKNDIAMKGHNLFWHRSSMQPTWLKEDRTQILPDIFDYMKAIADRYGDLFTHIDVANEHLCRGAIGLWGNERMPKDYIYNVFKKADELFPNAKLMANENHMACWVNFALDSSPLYIYLQSLIAHGCRLDAIGMQYHAFISKVHADWFGRSMFNIKDLDLMLSEYETFEKPIHISEITIPSTLFGEKVDEGLQREITENLVRLWFSHKNTEAIIWWNLFDGSAYADEDEFKGALLREDLSEKPVYQMLDKLINKEFRTNMTIDKVENNQIHFRGFYGDYELIARTEQGEKTYKVSFHK